MQKRYIGLALAAGLLAAPAAGAAVRDTIDANEVSAALRGVGATDIETTSDASGDPMVIAHFDDTRFQVIMYGCDDDGRCTSIQFRSGYDLDEGMTLEAVNDWNTAVRYGKVWLDDVDDPFIELDLDLSAGSSDAQVARYMQLWAAMVTEFEAHIGY